MCRQQLQLASESVVYFQNFAGGGEAIGREIKFPNSTEVETFKKTGIY